MLFNFIAESYHEYFTTPYFIFVRDTLSYLTLLGLHFAVCLSPSVLPFSVLEWVILVFFVGRTLMESKQFRNVKIDRGRGTVTKKQRGNKYTRCSENEEQGAQNEIRGVSRSAVLKKMCGKYLRYSRSFYQHQVVCKVRKNSKPRGDSHMKRSRGAV